MRRAVCIHSFLPETALVVRPNHRQPADAPQGCRVKTRPSERDIEIVRVVKAVVDGKPTLAEIGKRWGTSRANVHRIFHTWKDWKPNGAIPAQSTHQVVGPGGGNIIDIHAAVHLGPTPETEANGFELAAADKAPVEICGPAAQKVDQEQAKPRLPDHEGQAGGPLLAQAVASALYVAGGTSG